MRINFGLTVIGILGFVLLISHPAAFSQTPDGQTPAEETVCNVLQDATPGLYGLCVAYCEAHDADLSLLTGEIFNNSKSNNKLLQNYRKKMKANDPDMPCLASPSPCPCFSEADLSTLAVNNPTCFEEGYNINISGQDESNLCTTIEAAAISYNSTSGYQCFIQNIRYDEIQGMCLVEREVATEITEEEYQACKGFLETEMTNRNLLCGILF